MSTYDDLPSDSEPRAEAVASFAKYQKARAAYKGWGNVTSLEVERNRRALEKAVTNWLPATKLDGEP